MYLWRLNSWRLSTKIQVTRRILLMAQNSTTTRVNHTQYRKVLFVVDGFVLQSGNTLIPSMQHLTSLWGFASQFECGNFVPFFNWFSAITHCLMFGDKQQFQSCFSYLVLNLAKLHQTNSSNFTWKVELTVHGQVKSRFALCIVQLTVHEKVTNQSVLKLDSQK